MYLSANSNKTCFEMQSTTLWTSGSVSEHTMDSDMIRLLYAAEGVCSYQCAGVTGTLQGDRMLLLRGALRYQLIPDSGNTSLTCIDIRTTHASDGVMTIAQMEAAYAMLHQYLQSNVKVLPFQDCTSVILSLLRLLTSLSVIKTEDRRIFSGNLIGLLLESVMLVHQENIYPTFGRNPHVRKALQFLHENYALPITAEDAARAAGIHPVYLSRLFYAENGVHLRDYLTRLRIERAKTQLARTRLPIQTVATRCGFSTHPYFTRVVLRKTGITPQEYRHTYDITCDYGNYEKHIRREVNE